MLQKTSLLLTLTATLILGPLACNGDGGRDHRGHRDRGDRSVPHESPSRPTPHGGGNPTPQPPR